MQEAVNRIVQNMGVFGAEFDGKRLDANETMTFARELEHIYAKVYETEFPALLGRQLVPENTEGVDPADESATTTEVTGFGQMKKITNWAKDFPGLTEQGHQFTGPIYSWGGSFEYTLQDMRRAARIGRPLVARKAVLARNIAERTLDKLLCTGDTTLGLYGLANLDVALGVGTSAKQTTGFWSAQTDPSAILKDVVQMASDISNNTGGDHTGNTLALDLPSFNYIRFTKLASSANPSDQSILQYLLKNVDGLTSIVGWNRLNTACAGGHSRAVMYDRTPDVLFHIMAQPLEIFPPQQKGLTFESLLHMRWGGVRVPRPKAITYMDQLGS